MKRSPEESRPIRVLLWSPAGSGEHYNGPGSFAYRMYSAASPGRFEITLAHGYPGQERYPLFAEQHLIAPFEDGARGLWRFLRASHKWLAGNADRFDVFHGLSAFHQSMEPAYFAQKRGLPAVAFVASHGVEFTDKGGLRGLIGLPRKRRKMARRLSALIAMSRATYEELAGFGVDPARIARIPMAVNTRQFRPVDNAEERSRLRRELGWPDRPTLLYVGVIAEGKHLLVEAIGRATVRGLDCQLALAGPEYGAEYVQFMKRRAQELGVQNRVMWLGFRRDIAPVYRAADVYGLVSEREGMPASVVEAMASGLPTIGGNIAGISDLVESGVNGTLVDADPDQIAAALLDYVQQPRLAQSHGEAARERAVLRHCVHTIVQEYERLFRQVIQVSVQRRTASDHP
jgi:glycosyltransferase involved in cell wall biosynthesis